MFTIRVDSAALAAALSRLSGAASDLSPALDDIGDDWIELARLCFTDGVSPYGDPWAPIQFRMIGEGSGAVQADAGQPLLSTGVLRNSIGKNVEGNTLTVGTDLIYAGVHQYGATIKPVRASALRFPTPTGYAVKKSVTIPARPYLPTDGLPDEWAETAETAIADYMQRALNG